MKQYVLFYLFPVSFFCFFLISCNQEKLPVALPPPPPGEAITNDVQRLVSDLASGDILVQVNHSVLTRAGFEERLTRELNLRKARASRMTVRQFETLKENLQMHIVSSFVTRQAMLEEAKRLKIVPLDEDIAAAEAYIAQVCKVLKTDRPAYAKTFEGGEEALQRFIQDEATLRALIEHELGDKVTVSNEEAQKLLSDLEKANAESEATNTVLRATIDTIHANLQNGGQKFAESPLTWEPVLPTELLSEVIRLEDSDFLPEDEVEEALKNLLSGAWTPVLEQGETFDCFYRIPTPPMATKPPEFIRIYAKKDLGYLVPSLQALKRDILSRRQETHQKPWVEGLIKKVGIRYPNGVNWFPPPQKRPRTPHLPENQ